MTIEALSFREIAPSDTLSLTSASDDTETIAKIKTCSSTISTQAEAAKVLAPSASRRFYSSGVEVPGALICTINGICVRRSEAKRHGEYLAQMSSGVRVNCIYNKTNGPVADFVEVMILNYSGISFATDILLSKTWTQFHEANKDNPHAKLLQICHSQGALHVRNTLKNLSPEIRARVIVVAIAPAAIIPEGLCFESYHYTSKNDFIPMGELFWTFFMSKSNIKFAELTAAHSKHLTILPSHPDVKGWDHDFQSPTFQKVLQTHIQEYLAKYGPPS